MIVLFRRLLTLDGARRAIRREFEVKPLGVEAVPLLAAVNRVLAEDVVSSLDVPPFCRSTVDGYAVRAVDTFGAGERKPAVLRVCGTVDIGELPNVKVGRGEVAEIVTGAPVPEGADAVVMLEYAEREGGMVSVLRAVVSGENVMAAGSDVARGETVLRAGRLLGSREIGVLAALGLASVRVFVVPRVAVLSTGPEVVEPGHELSCGKIYDINAYSLCAAVRECGGEPVFLGVFQDRLADLHGAVEQGLACADLVLTSGGVSVGPKDVMPEALGLFGGSKIIVCGIMIKPGKPTTVALAGGKLVFSLPGHPASALLVFHLLVRPLVEVMAGRKESRCLEVGAFAGVRMFPAKGRRTFVMVRLEKERSGRLLAVPAPVSVSGAISTLARADGFVEIPDKVQFVDSGEKVTVRLFRELQDERRLG
jgi:putative molybdopterin biosynthesis protein